MTKISFSFGENWKNLNQKIQEEDIDRAIEDIEYWIGKEKIKGKNVIDIGSGSGIHSLSLFRLGVKSLLSFDYDKNSVEATTYHWLRSGEPSNWKVEHGSILDKEYIAKLGQFDIVYSWGVLHHTGNMWQAINNALSLVNSKGLFFITIYNDRNYDRSIKDKTKYNNQNKLGKRLMELNWILKIMLMRSLKFKNPFAWNEKKERGMNVYNDIVDWLGGLPYEIANEDEMLQFGLKNNLTLKRISCKEACHYYLFQRND